MRKTATIRITAEGRDKGSVFVITEMSAMRAEAWAIRAFLAMSKGGVDIPDDIAKAGIAGLASFGLEGLASLAYDDAKPLLDEMLTCVAFVPDPKRPDVVRALIEDDIEEVATYIRLRTEVFKLHVNFSASAGRSEAEASPMAEVPPDRTPTFRGRSGR